jgi:hypothetical protein
LLDERVELENRHTLERCNDLLLVHDFTPPYPSPNPDPASASDT